MAASANGQSSQGLSTKAARALATTTKTVPQIAGLTPRWILQLLPWVAVDAGSYRVNRRRLVSQEPRRIAFEHQNGQIRVTGQDLTNIPLFCDVDEPLLASIANSFAPRRYAAGEAICHEGDRGTAFYILAEGSVEISTNGPTGEKVVLKILMPGDHFGEIALLEDVLRTATATATVPSQLLTLERDEFGGLLDQATGMRDRLASIAMQRLQQKRAANEYGEAALEVASYTDGTPELSDTFADYEEDPREYTLNILQSVVSVQTRVTDLYNEPIDQLKEQLRQTIEEIKEKQESELINNLDFGLLHAAAPSMRVSTRKGPPTPDDMDELLALVWKKPAFFLAHPRAIAAFGRECTRRGVPPPTIQMFGSPFLTWRGVPIVPCDKLHVGGNRRSGKGPGLTSILLLRVGEKEQGVVGLHQPGISGEQQPSLTVRFMGIGHNALASYLVTLYSSAAVLTEDALGILENVEVGNYYDYQQ